MNKITCPFCHQEVLAESQICAECDKPLHNTSTRSPNTIPLSNTSKINSISQSKHMQSRKSLSISLIILDSNSSITLQEEGVYTLGRISDKQPVIPDIDLSYYDAYEAGVSRLHASITISDSSITIMDLGSFNGTQVNAVNISPNEPHTLESNDVLTLGNLDIKVIIEESS